MAVMVVVPFEESTSISARGKILAVSQAARDFPSRPDRRRAGWEFRSAVAAGQGFKQLALADEARQIRHAL